MRLNTLRPILWTDKWEETILFYTEILGFSVSERKDNWGWASLFKDAVELMVAKPNESMAFEKAVFTGSLYFTTNDVDGLWNHLKDKVKVCYEIESFEWQMKEFAIYDNNGYIIQFGQNIEE